MEKGEVKTKSILKRILSLFIINVMLISLFAPYSKIFATLDNGEIRFEVDSSITSQTQIDNGDSIDVYIYLTGTGKNLVGFDGLFRIDDSLFQITSLVINSTLRRKYKYYACWR